MELFDFVSSLQCPFTDKEALKSIISEKIKTGMSPFSENLAPINFSYHQSIHLPTEHFPNPSLPWNAFSQNEIK